MAPTADVLRRKARRERKEKAAAAEKAACTAAAAGEGGGGATSKAGGASKPAGGGGGLELGGELWDDGADSDASSSSSNDDSEEQCSRVACRQRGQFGSLVGGGHDNILVNIAEHLGDAKDLGRLEVAIPSFRSPVQEAARTMRWKKFSMVELGRAPRRNKEPFLVTLHELQKLAAPAKFTLIGSEHVVLSEEGALATRVPKSAQSQAWGACDAAVCGDVAMRAGEHYAEIELLPGCGRHSCSVTFGVVPTDFVPSVHGAAFYAGSTIMLKDGSSNQGPMQCTHWPGYNFYPGEGDTIGLLLDMDHGSIAVYRTKKDNPEDGPKRMGMMFPPGSISGPCRWAVDLGEKAVVRIVSKPPPVVPRTPEDGGRPWHGYEQAHEMYGEREIFDGSEDYGPNGQPYGT